MVRLAPLLLLLAGCAAAPERSREAYSAEVWRSSARRSAERAHRELDRTETALALGRTERARNGLRKALVQLWPHADQGVLRRARSLSPRCFPELQPLAPGPSPPRPAEADAAFQRGKERFEAFAYREAIPELRQAFELAPGDHEIRDVLLKSVLLSGRLPLELDCLSEHLDGTEHPPELTFLRPW